MPLDEFLMSIFNVILIIVSFCSIFNFIAMLCSEITISTTICIILFIAMFIMQGAFSVTANSSQYINQTFVDEYGNTEIVSQTLDPNYPGEEKVKFARAIYLLIPQGQAMEIGTGDVDYLYVMPFYSIGLIFCFNALGVFIFSRKELK